MNYDLTLPAEVAFFNYNNIMHKTFIGYEEIGYEEIFSSILQIYNEERYEYEIIGVFKLSKNATGINNLQTYIIEEYQGRGYSWILLYIFFKFIENNKPNILRDEDMLLIDTDASYNENGVSYWEKIGLKESRHAYYESKLNFPLAGYEKSIDYRNFRIKNYDKSVIKTREITGSISIGGDGGDGGINISSYTKNILIDFLTELDIKHKNKNKSELIKIIKSIEHNKLNIKQLKIYCKFFKIKGYSKYSNKKALIQYILSLKYNGIQ